jgi:glycosyltransferase involved in cell wall biosynthesis
VRLVVAGVTTAYPDYQRKVQAAAAALPAGRVTFCGNRDDMAELFRACDVVVHAGTVEGMPLGLIEAQSCGKPVIAYGVSGVPEAVLDGVTGLLAAPRDVTGLAGAVAKLVGNPRVRAKMGAAARAHVLAHHRIEDQARRNVLLLAEMCYRSGPVTT